MKKPLRRRQFIKTTAGLAAGLSLFPLGCQPDQQDTSEDADVAPTPESPGTASAAPLFKISLAQWSLHKAYFGGSPGDKGWDVFRETLFSDNYRSLLAGDIDPINFPVVARQDYGIDAVELVNTFYFDRAEDMTYLADLKGRADGEGVSFLIIMCDAVGNLGDPDQAARRQAVEGHYKWIEAAKYLGCHSIRVNAESDQNLPMEEQQRLAASGLRGLCEFADQHEIDVIVENHGGPSSNGLWLAGVMEQTDHPRVGTLPDFGNFDIGGGEMYDRYKGITELMPYAKAVSAKSHEFDDQGNEVHSDFRRIMKIVLDAGYRGYVGIEYEGSTLSEPDGIRATKALLERVREELAADYA